MPFIPHTEEDTALMLEKIGVNDIESLFDEIPKALRDNIKLNIPAGMNEMQMLKHAYDLSCDIQGGTCFVGAGAYDHHIPAVVWDITTRGEFLTSYTPYQAEASQGTLQLLYEFQTMIATLTGMEVANAGLYDGATALAEAILMAVRLNTKSNSNKILISAGAHPLYVETLKTIVGAQEIELILLPYDVKTGITDIDALKLYDGEDISALVIPQPNFFGCLEAVDVLTDWAKNNKVITIASVNPISLGLLKPPGAWGAQGVDIVCGEGQPLGVPMAAGGPYFGFFSTKKEYVRQMPGRVVGRTVDKDGNRGFTLTLQAREQHIRRAKATSNICTNQGLLVTAATIYMSLMGESIRTVARACHYNAQYLVNTLTKISNIDLVFNTPFFHEALLNINQPAEPVLAELQQRGIIGGYNIGKYFPEFQNCILVAATEKRTLEEIKNYAETLEDILQK